MTTNDTYLAANAKTAKERGVIAPAFFAHAALKTSRLDEMTTWFEKVLNAEVMFKSPLVCFMTYDEEHHRIALLNMPDLKDSSLDTNGVDHLSFAYQNIDELMSTYYRLKEESIVPFWTILHGPTLSMYFKSPDGGNVELQIDVFETAAELMNWLSTGAYDENPIGIKVDIEEIFEKYKAGAPAKELLTRRQLYSGESFMEHIVM